jgi:hypothetical protein
VDLRRRAGQLSGKHVEHLRERDTLLEKRCDRVPLDDVESGGDFLTLTAGRSFDCEKVSQDGICTHEPDYLDKARASNALSPPLPMTVPQSARANRRAGVSAGRNSVLPYGDWEGATRAWGKLSLSSTPHGH